MEQAQRKSFVVDWWGAAFLIAVVVAFLLLPFPFIDKLNGVCFGI